MATPGANLEALVNLQDNQLQKLIESLQGIAAARTGTDTQTVTKPPHIPAGTNTHGVCGICRLILRNQQEVQR